MLKEEVDEDDISRVVSTWTGIPVQRLLEGERDKLVHLKEIRTKGLSGRRRPSKPSQRRL